MPYYIQPLNMIQAPNYYSEIAEGKGFNIIDNNSTTIWFALKISDDLGNRRFIPATGSVLQVEFPRMPIHTTTTASTTPTKTPQSVIKNATQDANDKALYKIDLSATETQTIRAGTVKVTLTQGANVSTWVENYIVQKTLTKPGC